MRRATVCSTSSVLSTAPSCRLASNTRERSRARCSNVAARSKFSSAAAAICRVRRFSSNRRSSAGGAPQPSVTSPTSWSPNASGSRATLVTPLLGRDRLAKGVPQGRVVEVVDQRRGKAVRSHRGRRRRRPGPTSGRRALGRRSRARSWPRPSGCRCRICVRRRWRLRSPARGRGPASAAGPPRPLDCDRSTAVCTRSERSVAVAASRRCTRELCKVRAATVASACTRSISWRSGARLSCRS